MSLQVGSKCLLEGVHDGTVRYIGSTSFGNGNWYGVEMDNGLLGRNNGTVDGVRYFDTAGGGMTALFVQRGRLSEANRTRDTMDLGALRTRSVGSPVNIGGFGSRLGPIPRDSASLSPERLSPERLSPERTTTRRMRTKSSINPREIEQATNDRRKLKLIQKRARNRTSLNPGAPPSPGSLSKISDDVAHHVRESEMRGEIMRLQKEHMKTLMVENKELMETNDRLVAHVAEIEAKHAQVAVEHSHLGGAGDISYHAIVSERDLAVHKLAELVDQFQTFKNTAANSNSGKSIGDRMLGGRGGATYDDSDSAGGELDAEDAWGEIQRLRTENATLRQAQAGIASEGSSGFDSAGGELDAEDAWREVQRLRAQNATLRRAVQGDPVDLSDCFPDSNALPDASASEVRRLKAVVTSLETQLVTARTQARSAAATSQSASPVGGVSPRAGTPDGSALRASMAEARVQNLTMLIKQLSNQTLPAAVSASVAQAINLPTAGERGRALQSIFENASWMPTWDNLDASVARQNKEMDRNLKEDSMLHSDVTNRSGLSVTESFAAMRSRLTGRLQKVLHNSNSIRIRSQVLTPVKPEGDLSRSYSGSRSPRSPTSPVNSTFPSMHSPIRHYSVSPRTSPVRGGY